MNKSPCTAPTTSRTCLGKSAPVQEIRLRIRGPSGSSASLQTSFHPPNPSVICNGHVNFPDPGSICKGCRTMLGSHGPSNIASSAFSRGQESSSRIHTASAPWANASSITTITPPAFPRFSGIRRTVNSNGRSCRCSKHATVSSVDTLSATITRSGGRVWRARALTQAKAVAARFIVAKTAVIFREEDM